MQNQNSTQTSPTQKQVLPQVWYHPSIQVAGGGASAKTNSQTSSNQNLKSRPGTASLPQTRTKHEMVQKNQNLTKAGSSVKLLKHHADGGPKSNKDPNPTRDGVPPGPDQVPLDATVHLDQCLLEKVEVQTRGQRTNPDWFIWRKNRITASVAHCIAHSRFANGKSKAPPHSYLATVTGEGPRFQTRAMSWGVQMEAEAVRRYQKQKSAMGRPVSVLDCGLFIDAQRPWLAASPDGIVTDSRSGQRLLCLEVKCPYKHRHRRVEEACREDPAFCLQIQDQDERQPGQSPVYHLKTSHSYFTQVQCQLAVTGLKQADFVVFTLKEMVVVPVTFDPTMWEETVTKLEVFYRKAVLPYISQKMQQDTAHGPEL
uniref:YqaJ viral recombinase domain-containing protein n=1 Tax=Iconisemion striatum TaxID=60296 RepID=A0A1A7XC15_9TELE